jgi:hypothetical protein
VNAIEELLKRITTKGDIAVASLGYVAGYVLDAVLLVHGIPPGVGGALGSAVGIGAKNGIQSIFGNRVRPDFSRRAHEIWPAPRKLRRNEVESVA